jgi:hypothetical protein
MISSSTHAIVHSLLFIIPYYNIENKYIRQPVTFIVYKRTMERCGVDERD